MSRPRQGVRRALAAVAGFALVAGVAAVGSTPVAATVAATADTEPPSRPGAPTMVSATPHTVTLTWTPSTDNVGVASYRIDIVSMGSMPFLTSPTNTVTFTDLAPGGYVFVVTAFDAAGNRSQTSEPSSGVSLPFPADPTPPTRPTGLAASAVTDTGALLTWQPSTDNFGVVKYDLWSFTGGQFVRVGSTPTTSFQLGGLIPDTSYTIGVQAVDTHENGSDLAFVSFRTTGVPDTTPPTTPGPPSATAVTDTSVSLTWGGSTDDRTPARYEVYRIVDTGLSFATSSTTTSATVFNLTATTEYTFVVIAVDAAGNRSPRSAPVTVTTRPTPIFACRVRYAVTPGRRGTFTATVTLTNNGTLTWNGWVFNFTFPGKQRIRSGTGAVWSQQGQAVRADNLGDNFQLPPGQSLQLGFTATFTRSNPPPTVFTVNLVACTAGESAVEERQIELA